MGLRLLLWKNALLKRRNVFSALSEVLLPLSFILLLVWLQTLDKDKDMKERDWTCPQQSAFSPTLFTSQYLEEKAIDHDSDRDDEFLFSVNTEGAGAGLQTVPPFLYVMTLAAKTESKFAFVSSDAETRIWLEDFARELDRFSEPLDHPLWQGLRASLDLVKIPFCRFSKLVVFFNSSKELDEYVVSKDYGEGDWDGGKNGCPQRWDPHASYRETKPKLFAAIELYRSSDRDKYFDYSLRMNMSVLPITYPKVGLVDPLLVGVEPIWQDNYLLSGFSTIQLQVDRHLIGKKSKRTRKIKELAEHSICDSLQPILRQFSDLLNKPNLRKIDCMKILNGLTLTGLDLEPLLGPASYVPNQIRVAPFPTPDYTYRPFYEKIENVMSLVLLLCYLWPTSRLIRGIVHEKEFHLRESMLQMGVSMFSIMASHIITYGIVLSLVALFITIITRFNIFSESDPTCVFAFFFLFGCNIVTYSFMVSVLFDRAKTASTAGVSLFFVTYMPFFAVNAPTASAKAKSMVCIFAPTAFGIGSTVLSHYEAGGEGVNWGNARNAPAENDLPFMTILLYLALDCFLYLFLGWYLNQVVASEFGVKKPWWFLFSYRYWSGDKREQAKLSSDGTAMTPLLVNNEDEENGQSVSDRQDPAFFEKPTTDLLALEREKRVLKIRHLVKRFDTPTGVKVAVNDFTLNLYEGQICVLLGPNGCGKSTTIKMLTGDIAPTAGTAEAFGRDVFENMDDLRKTMGVCPQHDCLWTDMTVAEHLRFVASQKGLTGQALEDAITEQIKLVGMEAKRDALSKSLSGGQKRKLSLAMALIGNSKLVFLDEPTSGMDSHSRRFVWNLLQTSKAGRIIVLTTHFLDEADALGDRIAIMSEGMLRCVGSSHFLKQKYGVGYTLTVLGNATSAKDLITRRLPESKVLSAMGNEMSFQVPFDSAKAFPQLFEELDAKKQRGEMEGYGVSVTTLDEVFVKVALGQDAGWARAEEDRLANRSFQQQQQQTSMMMGTSAIAGIHHHARQKDDYEPSGFYTQFSALFKKRAQYARRDKRSVCCNTLIPVVLLIVGLGMLKAFPLPQPPPLVLNEREGLQQKNLDDLQVVVDSPFVAKYIPESFVVGKESLPEHVELNNCTEDKTGQDYFDSVGLKRFSTFLREDRFHRGFEGKGRFGAIHFEHAEEDLVTATIFQNSSAMHSTGVYMNVLNRALLRHYRDDPGAGMTTVNAPFKFTARFQQLVSAFAAVSASISIIMAFSFIPAAVAVFVVREREVSAKHQQLLAGTSLFSYWISNYVFDVLMFLVPWFCSLICVWAFGIDAFNKGTAFVAVAVLFMCYGLAIIPFTYLTSFFFESHSTAQNVVLLINFITGLVLTIAAFVMSVIESTYKVNRVLEYVYRIFPGFCLGNGLLNLTINASKKTFGDGVLIKAENPFAWDVIGDSILYLLLESVVFFVLTWMVDFAWSDPFMVSKIESWMGRRRHQSGKSSSAVTQAVVEEDEDVIREVRRVDALDVTATTGHSAGGEEEDVVIVKHLRKVYPSGLVAVHDLTFGIKRGDVFALLGVNGAGKSTTLKMLSGEVLPTSGTATLEGLDILLEQAKVRRMIGYCPQFDALLDLLTVREHLELFGRLKGVLDKDLDREVRKKMAELRLEEFEHRLAGTLSGGNKRKLSVAIALIGDPPLILAE